MKHPLRIIGGMILAFIAFIVFMASVYTVGVNEARIIMRMGKIRYIENTPGLHFHIPFIESTKSMYTGYVLYDIPTSDVITSDKKSMIADDYVIWQIEDPVKYYQTLGGIRGRGEERIEAAVYNATKNTISSMTQDDVIAARGSTLTDLITDESNSDIGDYGININISEIKSLDLPDDNKNAVYQRMISERNNIAASYTAKGEADAKVICNAADREASVIIAEAKRDADKIIAEGETEYMRILSEAYNDENKADFYNFMRSLDSLKSLAGYNKTLILDKDSELAQILYGLR